MITLCVGGEAAASRDSTERGPADGKVQVDPFDDSKSKSTGAAEEKGGKDLSRQSSYNNRSSGPNNR